MHYNATHTHKHNSKLRSVLVVFRVVSVLSASGAKLACIRGQILIFRAKIYNITEFSLRHVNINLSCNIVVYLYFLTKIGTQDLEGE